MNMEITCWLENLNHKEWPLNKRAFKNLNLMSWLKDAKNKIKTKLFQGKY